MGIDTSIREIDVPGRTSIEDIKNTNSAVLFIDWRHEPCLNVLNKMKRAVDSLGAKLNGVKVYVFNVRNHVDMWDKISNDYKIAHSGVKLEVRSIPQIIYFYNQNRVPSLRINVADFDHSQLAMDLSRRYKLDYTPESNLKYTPEPYPDFSNDDMGTKFAGGASGEARLHLVEQQVNGVEQKVNGMVQQLQHLVDLVQSKTLA